KQKGSVLDPRSSILDPRSSILDPRSSILDFPPPWHTAAHRPTCTPMATPSGCAGETGPRRRVPRHAAAAARNRSMDNPLPPDLRQKMDAYWRAANYLSVGQIYLYDNPLLKEPLQLKHVKPRLLGHWGTTPGLNFIYVHLNRVIKKYDLNMMYVI